MNFITALLDPFIAGYIYGASLIFVDKKLPKKSPMLTNIDAATNAIIYGLAAEGASKLWLTDNNRTALSVGLLGISIYNFVRYIGNIKSNGYLLKMIQIKINYNDVY